MRLVSAKLKILISKVDITVVAIILVIIQMKVIMRCQVQARSSIVGNSASTVDGQQVFTSMINAMINEDYSISTVTNMYQSVLEHALSKVDFLIDTGIYTRPSNLNLNIGKTAGCNNKTLINNRDMKVGSNTFNEKLR